MLDGTINVCIGNYSAYNCGYLIDRWVSLPEEPEKLAALIEDMRQEAERLTGSASEEFYISDYDGMPFGTSYGGMFSEYTPIEDLNILAKVMEEHPDEAKAVQFVLDTGFDEPSDLLGLCNWIMQADEIPYYSYSIDPKLFQNDSNELKMGYSCALDEGLMEKLEELDIVSYFDFEHYGREKANYATLGEWGYIDNTQDMPREDYYSWDEIKEDIGWGDDGIDEVLDEDAPGVRKEANPPSPTLKGAKEAQRGRPKTSPHGKGPKQ